MGMRYFHWVGLLMLLPLIGCANSHRVVLGDWEGYQPLSTPQGQIAIELVLYGEPTDKKGSLRMFKQTRWTEANAVDDSHFIDGSWSMKNVTVKGKTWRNVTLSAPEMVFNTYVLTDDNYLVPALDDGSPDSGQGGWGCCRLAPVPKNSFGYGRV